MQQFFFPHPLSPVAVNTMFCAHTELGGCNQEAQSNRFKNGGKVVLETHGTNLDNLTDKTDAHSTQRFKVRPACQGGPVQHSTRLILAPDERIAHCLYAFALLDAPAPLPRKGCVFHLPVLGIALLGSAPKHETVKARVVELDLQSHIPVLGFVTSDGVSAVRYREFSPLLFE